MKILILCADYNNILDSTQTIRDLSTIYGYFFYKWISFYLKDATITLDSIIQSEETVNTLSEHDFCLIIKNDITKQMDIKAFQILKQKIIYQIITICENNKVVGPEDLLLFMVGNKKSKTKRLLWGVDFDLLRPEKPEKIHILLDHKHNGSETDRIYAYDYTSYFIRSLLIYRKKNNNIVIKQIGNGQVDEVMDSYVPEEFDTYKALDFRKIYHFYNEAHIYIVTHPISYGLSAIECAGAGCLIVQPRGYLKKEIIDRLHHVTIINVNYINWDYIISQINVEKSIDMASIFSYRMAIKELCEHMKNKSRA